MLSVNYENYIPTCEFQYRDYATIDEDGFMNTRRGIYLGNCHTVEKVIAR